MAFIKEHKAWFREQVDGVPKDMLLPVHRAKGMKDYVFGMMGGRYELMYKESYYWVIQNSVLKRDGLLETARCIIPPYGSGTHPENIREIVHIEAYEKYLCTDGRIRYLPSPAIDVLVSDEAKRQNDEWWDDLDSSLRARGFYYSEEVGCWINHDTGEEVCF